MKKCNRSGDTAHNETQLFCSIIGVIKVKILYLFKINYVSTDFNLVSTVQLDHRHESLLRDIDATHCLHTLLTLGLFLEELLLTR